MSNASNKRGILAVGCYIPRLRLAKKTIAAANAWANPGLAARAKGSRAICAHDEDSITLAVAAARTALDNGTLPHISKLLVASTTLPFADRQNSTLIGEALGFSQVLQSCDLTGSLRAGTSALLNALNQDDNSLVIAADNRKTQPASVQELSYGAGGCALVTGSKDPIAIFIGSHSVSIDFTDHYRSSEAQFDYHLEERWVKEEGYLKIIPDAIKALLEKHQISPQKIDHLVISGPDSKTNAAIAKACNISPESVTDNLENDCGNTGTAHPLLMLCQALESAEPHQLILLAGFGQGCDLLLFETTERINEHKTRSPLQKTLAAGIEDNNYIRYLSFNRLVNIDWGMRGERDNRIAHSAFNRHRKTVTSFIGGRCVDCDTPQFPKRPMCANPDCRSSTGQTDEPFKDKQAKVKSFTEDWLALSENPPFIYGNVEFEGGGIVLMEFTGFEPGEIRVGTPLSMQFRIKVEDHKRAYKSYFWKAAPLV